MEENITSLRVALEVELSAINDTLLEIKFATQDTNNQLERIADALVTIADRIGSM